MLKKTQTFKFATIAMALLFTLSGCTKWKDYFPNDGVKTEKLTIAEIVSRSSEYTLLKKALAKTELTNTLNQPGALTVFAPDNKAFADAGFPDPASIDNAPTDVLKGILLYHVVGSKLLSGQIPLADNTPVTTLQGKDAFVTKKGNKISINGANVVKADVKASNGVIHGIDRLLMPPTGNIVELAQSDPALTYLVAAVLRASQGSTNVAALLTGTGPLTVFAPTNQAFVNAGFPTIGSINNANPDTLANILSYHVITARIFSANLVDNSTPATLNGNTVLINLTGNSATVKGNSNATASSIIKADLLATNGVVHVIDQVLLP